MESICTCTEAVLCDETAAFKTGGKRVRQARKEEMEQKLQVHQTVPVQKCKDVGREDADEGQV